MRSSSYFSGYASPPLPKATTAPPTVCPVCRSTVIAGATPQPDENAYWRCQTCGEVWNAGRRASR